MDYINYIFEEILVDHGDHETEVRLDSCTDRMAGGVY